MSKLSRKSLLCALFAPLLPLVAKSAKSKTFAAGGRPPVGRACMVSTQSPEISTFGDTRRVIKTPQVAEMLRINGDIAKIKNQYATLVVEHQTSEINSRARAGRLLDERSKLEARLTR